MRQGLAYLQSKTEVRSYKKIVQRLNKCCDKHGKNKTNKNGCKDCPALKECVELYEQRISEKEVDV